MLSRKQIKYIRSLELKKFRNDHGTFIAEGSRLVNDMLSAFESELIVAKPSWMATQGDIRAGELLVADDEDIRKASLLKNPQDVIAVFKQPVYDIGEANPCRQLVLVSDGIQDPGNLGTIIRLADWFGIEHIVCSRDTADAFGPKTVQATMGALARVKVHYARLEDWLQGAGGQPFPIYGAFLDGGNIYCEELSATGAIIMGNEGNGIRPAVEAFVTSKLFVPSYPANRETSESLNVAIATAIVCAEFRRRLGPVVPSGLG
jgi:TrmH family RNA methyltransferase